MHKENIKVICYLEGKKVPVRGVSLVTNGEGLPQMSVDIIGTNKAKEIKPDTIIQVFVKLNKENPHLLYDGLLSGRNIAKSQGVTNISFGVNDFRTKMENTPPNMLSSMQLGDGGRLYTSTKGVLNSLFAGYTLEEVTTNDVISNIGSVYDFTGNKGSLERYLKKFFSNSVGESLYGSIDYPSFNGPSMKKYAVDVFRLGLMRSHRIVGSNIYDAFAANDFMQSFIQQTHNYVVSGSGGGTISSLSKPLQRIGLNYYSIPNYSDVEKDNNDNVKYIKPTPISSDPVLQKDAKVTVSLLENVENPVSKYIISPKFMNQIPPACNYIKADSSVNLNISINNNPPTRTMTYYQFDNNGIPIYSTFPQMADSININGGNEAITKAFKMTDEEMLSGIIPTIDTNDNILVDMANALVNGGKGDKSNLMQALRKITITRYMNVVYGRNVLTATMPYYNPHIVAGFPGLVYDENTGEYYYGNVISVQIRINQESGAVGTSVRMNGVREVESLNDITKINGQEVTSPFLPAESSKYEEVYRKVLGVGLLGKVGEQVKRPIIEESEYFEKFKDDGSIGIKDLLGESVSIKQAKNKIKNKGIYITERVVKVEEYIEELKSQYKEGGIL